MTTKEKVLEILNNPESESFVSGEKLAELLNVSRVAVNKTIKNLRDDGFVIEAVTNKGYKLISFPDKLISEKISNTIEELCKNSVKVSVFDTIDSTNTEAKRRCAEKGAFRKADGELTEGGKLLHKSLIIADSQTQGHGRMNRVFASPKNSGIYFSLIYSPESGVTNPAVLTAAAAVSVSKAIDELYGLDEENSTKIKWVNDIFLSDKENNFKKISGILTEGIYNFETGRIEAVIVGIGINVRNGNFDENIRKVAGSIEDILEQKNSPVKKVSRNEIASYVVKNLIEFYEKMEDKEESAKMIQEYKAKSMLTGKKVKVNPMAGTNGETYEATVLDISPDAELIVETENGEKKFLHSGEVSLHSYDFV